MDWEVLEKDIEDKATEDQIINALLKNRDITSKEQKEEFFNPKKPSEITLKEAGIKKTEVDKALKRIKKAKDNKETIVVYGDYDSDGVCATAIMWEVFDALQIKTMPYIPDRFEEGYGINKESIDILRKNYPKLGLIVTVDNGIVADEAISYAQKNGVDVIVTDHHQEGKKKPGAHSIIHTDKICGAAVSWILAREIRKRFKIQYSIFKNGLGLDLVAIGTIADLIPLLGINRSLVVYGLKELRKTKRLGLKALFKEARIEEKEIESYHIGFVIAPRLNAMGRMEHAIDSLRLLCTKNEKNAYEYARILGKTNRERQDTVEVVVGHALQLARKKEWLGAIILAHEEYHEGVIGLAASKLVEKFYRPAIVISKGKELSKASARSISGFNMIDAIRKFDDLLEGGGGHPMAAGFSIETQKLEQFTDKFETLSQTLLTKEILTRSLKVDLSLSFSQMSLKLTNDLKKFDPTGLGNPTPVFSTSDVTVLDVRTVGRDASHLKLKLEKDGIVKDAIGFGMGYLYTKLMTNRIADFAYNLEENVWQGKRSLQLKLKDIHLRT
ncbi:single-stranded-DNA-specific exonuclease RecJ [Candidatus Woesebacteria bacterium]|nr:single-stranded-DNA-specific exonuclease RecJ [Candidatus Woesebacteria bacterium]